ncbi:MAG: ankyrin repeat domain-containing protein [Pirellulaceae bacterium]
MGLFCVNFHVKGSRANDVTKALTRLGAVEFVVPRKKTGWVSFYESDASNQDEQRIQDLAAGVSRELSAPTIAFLVHDSDIASYWMYEQGELVDQFNSCPDYFEDGDEPTGPSGGTPANMIKYCRSGVSVEDLADLFRDDDVFAERMIGQLAAFMGIDSNRALSDYRDVSEGGSDGLGGNEFADDDSAEASSRFAKSDTQFQKMSGMLEQLTSMIGGHLDSPADPKVAALIAAAVAERFSEIDRLLSEGADIDGVGPDPSSLPPAASVGGYYIPGGLSFVTPLLAATLHKRDQVVAYLLDKGANPNVPSPLFGTPLHVACSSARPDLVRLLLQMGANANCRNNRGQTPRDIIAVSRNSLKMLAEVQAQASQLGVKLPPNFASLPPSEVLDSGWQECLELLDESQ